MTKVSLHNNGERWVFSINSDGSVDMHPLGKKMNVDLYLTPHTKSQF